MARMMGTQQELDLLTSLLFTVTNEVQYKERVSKLHEMTTVHRQALDAAVKAKGEAEAAVRNADTTTAERTQKAAAAEAKATAASVDLNSKKADYEAKMIRANTELMLNRTAHANQVEFQTAQIESLKYEHQEAVNLHESAVAAHRQKVTETTAAHAKKDQELKNWENRLTSQSSVLNEREKKLLAAEADLAARAKKVRDLFTSAA